MQQVGGFGHLSDMTGSHPERMHQAGFAIDADVKFATEIPLIAFLLESISGARD